MKIINAGDIRIYKNKDYIYSINDQIFVNNGGVGDF